MRADRLIVRRGLAASRTLAQRLIAEGAVQASYAGGPLLPLRASTELADSVELRVLPADATRFVSRGGLKLEAALRAAGVDPHGHDCLDAGQSTGGFTDCLLARGARRVLGLDVGHGQIHPRLAVDPRVCVLEGVNVRAPDRAAIAARWGADPTGSFPLVVCDLSFISLVHVLAPLAAFAAADAPLLALVKPQFELGPSALDRHGIVRKGVDVASLRERIERAAAGAGWRSVDWLDSPIAGGDGNHEYFLHAVRQGPDR